MEGEKGGGWVRKKMNSDKEEREREREERKKRKEITVSVFWQSWVRFLSKIRAAPISPRVNDRAQKF